MKSFLPLLFVIFISCNNNKSVIRKYDATRFKEYDLTITIMDYKYNLNSGRFKISFTNFVDTVELSANERNAISYLFFEKYIDTLSGEIIVIDKNKIITPDFPSIININKQNTQKSMLTISNYIDNQSDLKTVEKDIFSFKERLLKVLKNNVDFKNCMDSLKVAKQNDQRIFL